MARAINSFPVPVSPRSRIVESVGATVCICSNTFFKAGLSPIISSKLCSMRISSEVEFLLAEFAHPVNDLPIRERVFHPDGYLIGDMLQQLRVLLRKGLARRLATTKVARGRP